MLEVQEICSIATDLRSDIIEMTCAAGSGHPGGSLSCVDILCALYFGGVMDYSADRPDDAPRDRFILAKGHAAPALYAVLSKAGYMPHEELVTLRKLGSRLQGHPDSTLVPGVEVSTGSLGQGLSIASGLACGIRLNGEDTHVFTLLGDGECEEGQVWEAAMFAAHQKLDGLTAIIDSNGLQIDGTVEEVCGMTGLCAKFEAFGWDVCEVDGHDVESLVKVLSATKDDRSGKPHAVIAHTVKGKGVSFMEGQCGWHGKAPSADEAKEALEELSGKREG